MLTSALFAGCAAGLLAALLHFAFVQKYILLSEQYESGAVTHFASGSAPDDAAPAAPPAGDHAGAAPAAGAGATDGGAAGHDATAAGTAGAGTEEAGTAGAGTAGAGDHGTPPSDLTRNGFTVLFLVLVYSAYAILLLAGFGLARAAGHEVSARDGVLWGLAGFAAFQMAPAMGLAPGLPGTIAAEMSLRQTWWWGTVAATGGALALLGYGRKPWALALAAVLLAAPHLVGAPQIGAYYGVVPPEVSAAFAARVLGVGLVVWVCLGWLAGRLWHRSAPA